MTTTLHALYPAQAAQAQQLAQASVTGRAGQWLFLDLHGAGQARALKAESCLLEPEHGDVVLVVHGTAQPAYVLAVLTRQENRPATLTLPGGAALRTEQGRLDVQAGQLGLHATERAELHAPHVRIAGGRAETAFERLDARFGVVAGVAHAVTTVVGRLVQKTRDSFRSTENLDETRAGRMRLHVEDRLHMKAGNATLLADGHVKIDGDKIDLG